jgi:hypothetical protein
MEGNTREKREKDNGTKGIKERNKGSKGLRYERVHYPLNFNGPSTLVM